MKIKVKELYRNKAIISNEDYKYAKDMNERIVIEYMNQVMTIKPQDIENRIAFIENDKVYFWWEPDSLIENIERPANHLQDGAKRSKYLQV